MTVPLRCVLDTNICIKQFIVDPLTPKVNQLFDCKAMKGDSYVNSIKNHPYST
ncbi:hypothetical protein [Phormidium nigroviride]